MSRIDSAEDSFTSAMFPSTFCAGMKSNQICSYLLCRTSIGNQCSAGQLTSLRRMPPSTSAAYLWQKEHMLHHAAGCMNHAAAHVLVSTPPLRPRSGCGLVASLGWDVQAQHAGHAAGLVRDQGNLQSRQSWMTALSCRSCTQQGMQQDSCARGCLRCRSSSPTPRAAMLAQRQHTRSA